MVDETNKAIDTAIVSIVTNSKLGDPDLACLKALRKARETINEWDASRKQVLYRRPGIYIDNMFIGLADSVTLETGATMAPTVNISGLKQA